MKIKIYIVDDHALFRKGLCALVNAEQDMEVCGEGEDCVHASDQIRRLKPDVVVTDITLKGADGIELIKNIKASEPLLQIVVLSTHDESTYALRVIRSGAQAYVMKSAAADSVIAAIRRVRTGQLYVSEYVASQMLNRYALGAKPDSSSEVASLTDRELEVLNLIGTGVTTRNIAGRLHVSIKTIETHRAHIKEKLNLSNTTQLMQFAVRWVDKSPHVTRPTPPVLEDPTSEIEPRLSA